MAALGALKSGSLKNVVARAADKFKKGAGIKKVVKKVDGPQHQSKHSPHVSPNCNSTHLLVSSGTGPAEGTASSKSLSDGGGPKHECGIDHIDEDVKELEHSSLSSSL